MSDNIPPVGNNISTENRQRESKPKYCYNCGHVFVLSLSLQVKFCDQCGIKQTHKPISSSLELNESGYALPQVMAIPNNFRQRLEQSVNSFANAQTPFQPIGQNMNSFGNAQTPFQPIGQNMSSFGNAQTPFQPIGQNMNSFSNAQTPFQLIGQNMSSFGNAQTPFQPIGQNMNTFGNAQTPFQPIGQNMNSFGNAQTPFQPIGQNMNSFGNVQTPFQPIGQNVNSFSNAQTLLQPIEPHVTSFGNAQNPLQPIGPHVTSFGNAQFPPQPIGQNMNSFDNAQTPPQPIGQNVNSFGNAQTPFQPIGQNMNSFSIVQTPFQTVGQNMNSFGNAQNPHQPIGRNVNSIENAQSPLQSIGKNVNSMEKAQNPMQPLGQNVNDTMLASPRAVLQIQEVTIETDHYGDTLLHQYIKQNKTEEALMELRRLTNTYANDKEIFLEYVNKRNERREVALQSAIKNQNVEIIENLLENGVDVTILDHSGNNILHLIVLKSSTEEMVLRLLRGVFRYYAMYQEEFIAICNDQSKAFNNEGFAVLHEVTKKSFGNTLKILKENGANLNIVGGGAKTTALVIACKKRDWPIAEILVELGACVNIPTSSGWYPVHAAIEDNNEEKLELFMNNNVDIYGYTKIATATEETIQRCHRYMNKRRRSDSGKNTIEGNKRGRKRRRCGCGSEGSQVNAKFRAPR